MSKKKIREESSEISQAELVKQAAEKATNRDLITVRTRKGDNFPLLSDWEAGDLLYRVIAVSADGTIELVRVSRV